MPRDNITKFTFGDQGTGDVTVKAPEAYVRLIDNSQNNDILNVTTDTRGTTFNGVHIPNYPIHVQLMPDPQLEQPETTLEIADAANNDTIIRTLNSIELNDLEVYLRLYARNQPDTILNSSYLDIISMEITNSKDDNSIKFRLSLDELFNSYLVKLTFNKTNAPGLFG